MSLSSQQINIDSHSIKPSSSNHKKYRTIFLSFAIIYLASYCLIPYFFSMTIWPDEAQIYNWSQHFQWGYDQHPWFPPFIFKLFIYLTHYSPISIFLIGALLNLTACWGVWKLGQKTLPIECALLSALLLLTYSLVSFFLGMVNNNTFNFALWPVMYLCFYYAIITQRLRFWIATAVIAAFSTLSKYYTAFPLLCMLAFSLLYSDARLSFKRKEIYLALLVFALVLLPHIIWLFENNFISIRYALTRSQSAGGLSAHLVAPILFALEQIGNFFFIPLMIIYFIWKKCPSYSQSELESLNPANQSKVFKKENSVRFNLHFIMWMALGPLLLTIGLAAIFGWGLASEWGQALPCLWGLALMAYFVPKFSTSRFNFLLKTIVIVMYVLMFSFIAIISFFYRNHPASAVNFPANHIAQYADQQWQERYHSPLKYIISSDEYVGGVISFYSAHHPAIYNHCSDCINWVKKSALEKNGAMIVIANGYEGRTNVDKAATQMLKDFPNLIILPNQQFSWKHANSTAPKLTVWLAVLPPQS